MLSIGGGKQVDAHTDNLTRARQAYARQDWATAASHFDTIAADQLTAEVVAAYADAVWWQTLLHVKRFRLSAVLGASVAEQNQW